MGWHWRNPKQLLALAVSLAVAACFKPVTRLEPISPALVRAEELKQQQLVIDWQLRQLRRVEGVGHALLASAYFHCVKEAVPRPGILLSTGHDFGDLLAPAARAMGFADTLIVVSVAPGSAAERAGVRLGDRIVGLYGRQAPTGRRARSEVARILTSRMATHDVQLDLLRGSGAPRPGEGATGHASFEATGDHATTRVSVSFTPEMACPYGLVLLRDDAVNAFADGTNVFITSGILRFVEDDDQLAIVMAHEIAHNVMHHTDGQKANSILGGLLGAIIDIGASAYGVNTGGEFTKAGTKAGALAFSQDFEREADYVGMYIMATAGRSLERAPDFWRRMAQENATSIIFAGTHPTTAERFVRLDATVTEIERKIARGERLQPEMRASAPVLAQRNAATGRTPTAARRNSTAKSGTSAAPSGAPPDGAPSTVAAATPTLTPSVTIVRRDSTRAVISPSATSAPPVRESLLQRLIPWRRVATHAVPMTMPLDSSTRFVEWKFGPPVARDGLSLDEVITRARMAYEEGVQAREVGWLERARDQFYVATQYDGSVAMYHAALGQVLMRQRLFTEAEAVFSAATLLEPENGEFRRMLGEARRER